MLSKGDVIKGDSGTIFLVVSSNQFVIGVLVLETKSSMFRNGNKHSFTQPRDTKCFKKLM